MIGLLQRVCEARVSIAGETVGEIGAGLLILVGVERADDQAAADRLLSKLLEYRVFADDQGRMNRSLRDVGGGLLLVPQFTLVAETRKGLRPSFAAAAAPAQARELFEYLLRQARAIYTPVAAGRFGADMQVALVNDGPVTFSLQV